MMRYSKLLSFLVFLLVIPFCYSMGLLSNQLIDTLFFEPGLEKTYNHFFTTNCGFTQDYQAYVRMDDMKEGVNLTKYVTIKPSYFEDVPHDSAVPFTIHMKLPQKIDVAGYHEIRPGIMETQTWEGGQIGSKTGSEARIIIIVLYPYKYVKWSLQTENVNVNETATFKVNVQNLGELYIKKARATIKIYNTKNELIKTTYTDSRSINSTEQIDLFASFSTIGMLPGSYRATAILEYDENKSENNGSFSVGSLDVRLLSHTKRFIVNSTGKMEISVVSRWNNKIENLYADVEVLDQNNEPSQQYRFKTVSETLQPWQSTTLTGYFSNFGLRLGNYTIRITLNFDGASKIELINIEIYEPEKPEVEKSGFISIIANKTTLIGTIIVLLLVNIIWMLLKRRRR